MRALTVSKVAQPRLPDFQLRRDFVASKRPFLLCVLDGLGLNPSPVGNALAHAHAPNIRRIISTCPSATLITHGERVGLPEGQMGNSEVGHLNIGAGRIVEQWLLRIGRALAADSPRGDFLGQSVAYQQFLKALTRQTRIHVAGLCSLGGVHSHLSHLLQLLPRLRKDCANPISVHVITDGRDTAPDAALTQLVPLVEMVSQIPECEIATISGRFFAMDRDLRWERVRSAYQAIAMGEGPKAENILDVVRASYTAKRTDEFIEPVVLKGFPVLEEDALIFFNFREDRARELVRTLSVRDFTGFERSAPVFDSARVLTFTEYDPTFNLPYLFPPVPITNHLGEVLSEYGLTQLRTAETEKYPHVTYFFNGGVEAPYPGEERALVPSPRDIKTYDLKPEMSAFEVTDRVVSALSSQKFDLIVVNLANCDMVGHTGVMDAAVRAVESVDVCVGKMLAALQTAAGQALFLADHGNAEQMIDYETGAPFTSHTKFPVPVVVVGAPSGIALRTDGALCDVAPTVLELMQLTKPEEMTGTSLILRKNL